VLIDNPRPGLMRFCAKAFGVSEEQYIEVHSKFLDQFQKGLLTEQAFWRKVCAELENPEPCHPSLWGEAFRAAYAPRKDMFDLVSNLHKNGYKTALLSNTEAPAMEFFNEHKSAGFDVLVFSCMEGTAKPEPKIYQTTLERLGCPASRTVFTDDRVEFIAAAERLGLNATLFKNIEHFKGELIRLGVNIS
jgi:putative hydrolase of the HAD superfamily